ncbi:MAG: hypothetical protein ABSH32_17770 [Bryobacteraceae bacterium]|jgi:hypothetical protein
MLRQISMTEPLLYLTALPGMPVYDLKGRRIGRVKDEAVAPMIHPARVDRCLAGDDATVEDALAALRGRKTCWRPSTRCSWWMPAGTSWLVFLGRGCSWRRAARRCANSRRAGLSGWLWIRKGALDGIVRQI